MEIDITNKLDNKLLKREEILFTVTFDKTVPNRKDLCLKLASMVNANANLIVIQKVETRTGMHEAVGRAHVYQDEETMKQVERKFLLERGVKKEEKGKEAPKKDKLEEKEVATDEEKETKEEKKEEPEKQELKEEEVKKPVEEEKKEPKKEKPEEKKDEE